MVHLLDTMVDCPDTMVDLSDTLVYFPNTMVDLPDTMVVLVSGSSAPRDILFNSRQTSSEHFSALLSTSPGTWSFLEIESFKGGCEELLGIFHL